MRLGCHKLIESSNKPTCTSWQKPQFQLAYSSPTKLLILGKKPVLETLRNSPATVKRIIVSDDSLHSEYIPKIIENATKNNIPILHKSRSCLSRMSGAPTQDQGIVAEVHASNIHSTEEFLKTNPTKSHLVTFNNVTTPQNIGMAIRAIAAGGWLDGVLIPRVGICSIDHPLVFKAAAGTTTLPRLKLLFCDNLYKALQEFSAHNFHLIGLDRKSNSNIFQTIKSDEFPPRVVFVLGGESKGLSAEIRTLLHRTVSIPMADDVESLNVASAATLLAFAKPLPVSSQKQQTKKPR